MFGKKAFKEVPPLGVASLRVVFGAATLFLAARLAGAPQVPERRLLARLALCAVFGIAINQVLFLEGLSRSSATHAGILVAASPAITYGLGVLLGREAFRGAAVLGVALAGAGAAWGALAGDPSAKATQGSLAGDALLLANVASYAVYLVLVRDVVARVDPLRAIAWVFLFGAVLVFPLGVPSLAGVRPLELSRETWGSLAFILIGPTSLAYVLNVLALKRAPSSVAAVYTCAQPIIAIVSAATLLGERPPVLTTAGATASILAGVALVAGTARPVAAIGGEAPRGAAEGHRGG